MLRNSCTIGIMSLFSIPCFSGFYLGASVGEEVGLFKRTVHISQIDTFNTTDRNHLAASGVFGSIYAGYGMNYNRFYLAAEGNANLSTLEYDRVHNEYIQQYFAKTYYRIHDNEGLSLLPGFFLTSNSLLYARVGYALAKLRIYESATTFQSFYASRTGIRYGIGLRQAVTPRLAFMMDFTQINYRYVNNFLNVSPFLSRSTKLSPNSAQIGFGIIYNFGVPTAVAKEK